MNKPDAKKSLCWTCKHSLCIQETEQESLAYMNEPMQEDEDDNYLDLDSILDSSNTQNDFKQHTVEHERVKAICYYRPIDRDVPIIAMSHVTKCNRYEKED